MGRGDWWRRQLAAIVALSLPVGASATDRWVSTTGTDSADCRDPASPCATIQHAVDQALDGDVIRVAPGTYAEQVVVSSPITIQGGDDGFGNGGDTIVDGGGIGPIFKTRGSWLPGAEVTLRRLVIAHGYTDTEYGAGIQNTGDLLIDECIVRDNESGNVWGKGGGLRNDIGTVWIRNSTFSNNTAFERGGAVDNDTGIVVAVNSTFTDNAALRGGGINSQDFGAPPSLTNCTVTNNAGGGIRGRAELRNTIVAGNTGYDCFAVYSWGYNLIGSSSCTMSGPGPDLIGVDPMLDRLADHGGPTPTRAPRSGSPAIDAGDPTGCIEYAGVMLLTDQRGEPRAMAPSCAAAFRCDIGAYETTGCGATVELVYQAREPIVVHAPSQVVGEAAAGRYAHLPPPARVLFYQVDDGKGTPATIRLVGVAGDSSVQISF